MSFNDLAKKEAAEKLASQTKTAKTPAKPEKPRSANTASADGAPD